MNLKDFIWENTTNFSLQSVLLEVGLIMLLILMITTLNISVVLIENEKFLDDCNGRLRELSIFNVDIVGMVNTCNEIFRNIGILPKKFAAGL